MVVFSERMRPWWCAFSSNLLERMRLCGEDAPLVVTFRRGCAFGGALLVDALLWGGRAYGDAPLVRSFSF